MNARFFREESGHALAVFRILIGFLATANCLILLASWRDWFTEDGLTPLSHITGASDVVHLNLLYGATSEPLILGFLLLTLAASVCTMLGLGSRIATVVLFVCLVSLHHRSPGMLNSGDTLMRQWTFFLMLAPSGAALSLDRILLERRKGPQPEAVISAWPRRLIQFQIALVYLATLVLKLEGSSWWNGTATWISGSLVEMQRFPLPGFMLQAPFVQITTWYTLAIELALGTLVFWKPARKWVLLGGLALHAGIEYSMNIPLFAGIICSGYVAFYRGEEVRGWLERRGLLRRAEPGPA
ncbi:MAG: HTTM domain-containing protein [Fimbriimonadaceae bacterium]|nr:HTTM domain-containing protein [Fimbriimonadaceae bacterium]